MQNAECRMQNTECRMLTLSPCLLVSLSPCHVSPCHRVTVSPCHRLLEVVDGLALARVPAPAGAAAADCRGLHLDAAAAAAFCGALLQPDAGARGTGAPVAPAAPSPVRPV